MNVINANLKFKGELIPLNLSDIQYIVIHHPDAVTATPEQIHEWHLANKWLGAGYNEYIRKDGTVYIMRGDNVGAQCENYNSKSYGICCEGDYNKETQMPEDQFNSLFERIRYHKGRFPNKIQIAPHRQLCHTSCPGINFPMDTLIKSVNISSDGFKQAVQKIQNKGIISSPDYWLQNCQANKKVDGKYVNTVILRFVAMFKIVNTFAEAVDVLKGMGVVSSPEYWLKCVDGFEADGAYVRKLLINMGNKI